MIRKRRSKYTHFACSVDIMLESTQLPTLLASIDYFLTTQTINFGGYIVILFCSQNIFTTPTAVKSISFGDCGVIVRSNSATSL